MIINGLYAEIETPPRGWRRAGDAIPGGVNARNYRLTTSRRQGLPRLVDAYDNHYTAIIVSGDSDLTTPVRQIRNRFPNKRLIIAFPPARRSAELKKAARGHFVIGADKLRQNLLPNEITTPSGYVLKRPSRWY